MGSSLETEHNRNPLLVTVEDTQAQVRTPQRRDASFMSWRSWQATALAFWGQSPCNAEPCLQGVEHPQVPQTSVLLDRPKRPKLQLHLAVPVLPLPG